MVSASVATCGPRSEPPMPMVSTSVKRWPVAPVMRAVVHGLDEVAHLVAFGGGHGGGVLVAVAGMIACRPASAGARSAMCMAARCSVALTGSPANRRRRKPSRSAASASANSASSAASSIEDWRNRASGRRARGEAAPRAGSAANSGVMRRPSGGGERRSRANAPRARIVVGCQVRESRTGHAELVIAEVSGDRAQWNKVTDSDRRTMENKIRTISNVPVDDGQFADKRHGVSAATALSSSSECRSRVPAST